MKHDYLFIFFLLKIINRIQQYAINGSNIIIVVVFFFKKK